LDGQPLRKKGRKFFLPEPNDGKFIELKMGFDVFAPTFEYENETVSPVPPLPAVLLILAVLPMGLVGVGGMIGGALGGAAWYINLAFLHTDNPLPVRLLGVLAITSAAVGAWLAIAGKITGAF
jgi:hypothetical protein